MEIFYGLAALLFLLFLFSPFLSLIYIYKNKRKYFAVTFVGLITVYVAAWYFMDRWLTIM